MEFEKLTVCPECDDDNKRCRRQVDFMATMLSRQTHRPIGAILEEWEAELTPSRELFNKVLELRAKLVETEDRSRAALEETEARSWRMVRDIDIKLEAEQQKVAMLEATNINLRDQVEDRSRVALEEMEARSWRMVRDMDIKLEAEHRDMDLKLEAEQQKVAMLEATNINLRDRVEALEGWNTIIVTGSLGSLN